VRVAVREVCKSLEDAAFSDFQAAFFNDSEEDLRKLIQDIAFAAFMSGATGTDYTGVSSFRTEPLRTDFGKACFRVVFACQGDLQKITCQHFKILPFKQLGIRLPRARWVSKFSEKALGSWGQHVAYSNREGGIIEYQDSFEQDVMSLCDEGDSFMAGGESILIRCRFNLILFPIRFPISDSIMSDCSVPDVQVHSGMTIGKEDNQMAIFWVEASRQQRRFFQTPRELLCHLGDRFLPLVAQVGGHDVGGHEWLWSFAPPPGLVSAWHTVEVSLLETLKQEARKGYFPHHPKLQGKCRHASLTAITLLASLSGLADPEFSLSGAGGG
ncbi:unnamed protein product, partial [Symbiodinium necroappetens]